MEVTFYVNNMDDINDRRAMLDLVRDALIGAIFMKKKVELETRYQDGKITAGEYALLLQTEVGVAWARTNNIRDE